MPTKTHYYEHKDVRYPEITESIVERLNIYLASTIYKKEYSVNPQDAFNRIFISDVEAGENVNLTDAIQVFGKNLNILPFTVYNITDIRKAEEGLTPYGELGILFDPDLDAKVIVYPMQIELQYVSFFNSALDFYSGLNILNASKMLNVILYTPIEVNGVEKIIPIRVKYETTKGGLVNKFQDYLTQNKIYNYVTVCTVFYYEYEIILNKPVNGEPPTLVFNKVDDMILRLGKIRPDGRLLTSEQTIVNQNALTVLNSNITLGVIADLVTVTFNQPIQDFNNSELRGRITIKQGLISPLWNYTLDSTFTILTINIFGRDLSRKTIITLSKKILSEDGISMDKDYEIIIV